MTENQNGTTEYSGGEEGAKAGEGAKAAPEVSTQLIAAPQSEEEERKEGEENAAEEAVAPPKKRGKSRIFWNIFLIAIIAVGIYAMFRVTGEINPESSGSFVDVMKGIRPVITCIFVGVVLGIMALDCAKFCIINKTVTGKLRLSTSAKTSFLGRYYDAITPFATGGQPMQIYYLNSKGISGGNSSAIVLIRYITSILTWIILGGALMIYGQAAGVFGMVDKGATALKVTGWVGIGINLIIPVFVLLFLIIPKFMNKLTVGIVKLGKKIKLVKDVDKTTARATKIVTDFKTAFKIMATTPLNLVLLILVSFGEAFLTFSVPFFIMNAFVPAEVGLKWAIGGDMLLPVMSLNAFATFGASFIPTPGNSGVIESWGAVAFQVAAGATMSIAWSVLFWRLGVYYIYIIIGLVMTVCDVIKKNVAASKAKRAEQLSQAPPEDGA